jgi:hypothetical protein
MSEFAQWGGFYGIVGSAAGALIGLQFVVLTLIAQRPPIRAADAGAAFATPTILHLAAVLLLSALQHVPWQTITAASAVWGLMGLSGVVYMVIVVARIRKQQVYQPELEDWIFHVVLPLAAYLFLALSPFTARSQTRETLFGLGTAALVLLFVGIHNAWDAVTYHVFVMRPKESDSQRQP